MKSEAEMKRGILNTAKNLGIEPHIRSIMDRWDRQIKTCPNPIEKRQMVLMMLVELHREMNCAGPLVVDGVEILPADPTWRPKPLL